MREARCWFAGQAYVCGVYICSQYPPAGFRDERSLTIRNRR
jgi:hypothetical protein